MNILRRLFETKKAKARRLLQEAEAARLAQEAEERRVAEQEKAKRSAEEEAVRHKEEQRRRQQQAVRLLKITSEAQREELSVWIESLKRGSPHSVFGELDDAYQSAGCEPLPEPLEAVATKLRNGDNGLRKQIASAAYELFGRPGMKVLLYRASNGDRGLFHRLNGAFSGIGGWQT